MPAYIHLITGGQRSGKSRYAQNLALDASNRPLYLATAKVWDDDFQKRVDRHKQDRDHRWENIEEEVNIQSVDRRNKVVVIDCITLWLTNLFVKNDMNTDQALKEAKLIWEQFISEEFKVFVVSNEIGMGVHAESEAGRKFTDLQGWMNQFIAKSANRVTLMVSGLPLRVK
ncbi:MAG: bifunctional adenosylcobinamide kinase/adenosylcobinamide-phosphate guanylyltransferase [Bacteroidales bacterium]|nr:bifunctional adenosylcobinamide kinase/adenosylcobinamide-phosphate guanylyltransferase [Bacteroidales bacterium]